MDWFKQNKIKIGALIGSLLVLIQQAELSQNPTYKLILSLLVLGSGTLTGAGANIKSDKAEKIVADLKASGQFDRRG